ncbi:metallophosphoesterase [Tenacibaculum tangerinum]|uniref:Metallophosphoesterase n=1 Tax=Tenacibaculum tangerinum TaxID=3038772 RepID=A0ABY8L2W9_9FLAO|nr:metallophosphoesterase [Tenacibaculum tangerinum]WGH74548.1 metallophosphoesterase [Tenacibaculum tangerinum]
MPRRVIITFAVIGVLLIISEYYTFQALKTATKIKALKWVVLFISLLIYGHFFYTVSSMNRGDGQTVTFQWAFGWLLIALVPKIVVMLLLFGEDVVRWVQRWFSFFTSEVKPLTGRRKFLSQLALGIAAIPLASLLYGVFKGKFNYKVIKYQLKFKDLPEAFDGVTISHITDIHSGSFDNKEKIQYGVDLINEQQSDIILFTGDIVNNFAYEMDDWIPMFSELKAPMGKYSILGNHDYGDYSDWKTPEDKKANFQGIKDIHPKIGFELLLNEHTYIEKDGQKIALIGVENWGKGFNQAGDLALASKGVQQEDFKILLSHDPSHWEYKVKKDDFNYQLTLSGHTHGLQFGIEIPGWIKWSPAKYVYKQWAGLYEEFGRYVNVNRGFGYHAFPGRVGIWPEITVIELKKA